MKILNRVLFVMVVASLVTLVSCKKGSDPTPDPKAEQLKKLSKTWKFSAVTLDGVDKGTDYATFTLTISGTATAASFGYATAHTPALTPWPVSGSWIFGSDVTTQIIRDKGTADELALTYAIDATSGKLQISFAFAGNGYPGGRVNNVKGNWVFTLTPQ